MMENQVSMTMIPAFPVVRGFAQSSRKPWHTSAQMTATGRADHFTIESDSAPTGSVAA